MRRDLRELAAERRSQRVHGGALPAPAAVGNLQAREQLAPEDKRALGRAGAALVLPGQVVILDGGTTSLQVVQHLPLDLRATVVNAQLSPWRWLWRGTRRWSAGAGGRLFRHSMVNVGASGPRPPPSCGLTCT